MNPLFHLFADAVSSSSAGSTTTATDWNTFWTTTLTWLSENGIKLLISIVLIVILFTIINIVSKHIQRAILNPKPGKKEKSEVIKKLQKKQDKTLVKTMIYIIKIILKILIVIAFIGYLGIDTSIFASLVASLTVCIGLAVNGALSNLAGGILLMITRPFSVDDYIEAAGYSGTVEDIHIIFTILKTPDNKVVHIPNGALSTSTIINYSKKPTRRLEIIYSISYNASVEKAKEVILKTISEHPKVLQDPAPMCRMKEEADSSINLTARVWVKGSDYWDVNFDLQEQVYAALNEAKIEIPYNQMDIHIRND